MANVTRALTCAGRDGIVPVVKASERGGGRGRVPPATSVAVLYTPSGVAEASERGGGRGRVSPATSVAVLYTPSGVAETPATHERKNSNIASRSGARGTKHHGWQH